jgi:hypothetical protein
MNVRRKSPKSEPNLRPLRHPVRGRRCARSHPRHGRRRTTARRYRSGMLRQNRRAHPWAKRPDVTTRGRGFLFDSLVPTYSLLVRAVYTWHSPTEVAQPHVNKALTSVRCASFNLLVGASEREQLFALGMLCTGTKRGQFFWGLGSVACPCSRKFCVAIADVRKRTFHCAPCDPRVECTRECDLCSAFGFLYYRARHVISFLH